MEHVAAPAAVAADVVAVYTLHFSRLHSPLLLSRHLQVLGIVPADVAVDVAFE